MDTPQMKGTTCIAYHFVGCSNVYLKIIVKYEIDHHIRDPY